MADSSPTSNTVNIKKKSTYDMQRISSLQLFGAEKKEARPKTVDAPVTRLKLTLIGIIAANDSGVSKAIIQIDNKQTMVFSVGDKLSTGNAEIYEIQPDKVLLKRKGRLESLVLDRPDLDRRNDRQRGAQKGRLTYGVEEKLMTIPNQVKPSVQPEVRPPR